MMAIQLHTEHAELDAFSRNENRERDSLSRRLPQRDVEDIQFLWTVLPGRVGLASNMGAQIARLQQRMHRDVTLTVERLGKARRRTAKAALVQHLDEAAPDELAAKASEAEAAWRRSMPAHVERDIPEEPIEVVARVRNKPAPRVGPDGVTVYAKGYPHQTIHCASSGVGSGFMRMVTTHDTDHQRNHAGEELVSAPLTLESWAEPKNAPVRAKLRACWLALSRMIRQGDGDLVAVLYAIYGGELPPSELRDVLGDVAPLASFTATVQAHAERLTRRLRASLGADWVPPKDLRRERFADGERRRAFGTWRPNPGRHIGRRETVTAREAARDLLLPRHDDGADARAARLEARHDVKLEGEAILVEAGRVYLVARGAR